jgi:hypothetical protein
MKHANHIIGLTVFKILYFVSYSLGLLLPVRQSVRQTKSIKQHAIAYKLISSLTIHDGKSRIFAYGKKTYFIRKYTDFN